MTTGTTPADATMMGVVHDALRRDLARLDTTLTAPVAPDDDRRRALAEHVGWLLDLLHRHHRGEDTGLWPLVRERNAEAAALLDDRRRYRRASARRWGPDVEVGPLRSETAEHRPGD